MSRKQLKCDGPVHLKPSLTSKMWKPKVTAAKNEVRTHCRAGNILEDGGSAAGLESLPRCIQHPASPMLRVLANPHMILAGSRGVDVIEPVKRIRHRIRFMEFKWEVSLALNINADHFKASAGISNGSATSTAEEIEKAWFHLPRHFPREDSQEDRAHDQRGQHAPASIHGPLERILL